MHNWDADRPERTQRVLADTNEKKQDGNKEHVSAHKHWASYKNR